MIWECIVEDDCVRSCLIELHSFPLRKLYIDPIHRILVSCPLLLARWGRELRVGFDLLCAASTNRTAHVKLDRHAPYIHMSQPYMSNAVRCVSVALLVHHTHPFQLALERIVLRWPPPPKIPNTDAAMVHRPCALKQCWRGCLINRMERKPILHHRILFAVARGCWRHRVSFGCLFAKCMDCLVHFS